MKMEGKPVNWDLLPFFYISVKLYLVIFIQIPRLKCDSIMNVCLATNSIIENKELN